MYPIHNSSYLQRCKGIGFSGMYMGGQGIFWHCDFIFRVRFDVDGCILHSLPYRENQRHTCQHKGQLGKCTVTEKFTQPFWCLEIILFMLSLPFYQSYEYPLSLSSLRYHCIHSSTSSTPLALSYYWGLTSLTVFLLWKSAVSAGKTWGIEFAFKRWSRECLIHWLIVVEVRRGLGKADPRPALRARGNVSPEYWGSTCSPRAYDLTITQSFCSSPDFRQVSIAQEKGEAVFSELWAVTVWGPANFELYFWKIKGEVRASPQHFAQHRLLSGLILDGGGPLEWIFPLCFEGPVMENDWEARILRGMK